MDQAHYDTYRSISIAKHTRWIKIKEGVPPSKIRFFNETHMRRAPDKSREYVDQHARQVGKRIQELIYVASQDESENQVDLTQDDKDRIFLEAIETSSQNIYMYGTSRNKSSSSASDASSCSAALLEVAHQWIRELEASHSQL